jgi:NADH:ubiquinone oxidoreductase subunit K
MIMTLTILLFLCGIAGFILNRNNVILLIVAIELLLLAVEKFSCTTANYANSYLKNQHWVRSAAKR